MHFLLFFNILIVILQNSFSVHPGDPLPLDQFQSKPLTSEDLINANETIDSIDDKISSTLKTSTKLIDPTDDEMNSIDNIISTSTKFIPIIKIDKKYDEKKINFDKKLLSSSTIKSILIPNLDIDNKNNLDENLSLSKESSTVLSKNSISNKNLIKIGRWKHEDLQTNKTRYWYEPEGGHMGAGWTFDGYIFQAYNKSESDTEPVYAFHSEIRSVWTNTVQMDPQPPIIGNDQWISDGVSFYAFKTSMSSNKLRPVYRYWNKFKKDTTNVIETRITYLTMKKENNNNDNDLFKWTFDKILFYALPIDD